MNTQADPDNYQATYSPEDNKLRLYSVYRLDTDLYTRIKTAGFRWAPKQDLFVAPSWSPDREDILLELAGCIGDEDTSLADRSEQRAERFEGYQQNRANDAEQAYNESQALSDNIPMGQPILIGHHSEKRARKQADKIERAMNKAVSMWDTSEYWARRANGAIRSAKYKERADVRARRIKKLEAEIRKYKASYTPCPKTAPNVYEGVTRVWCGKGRGGSWVIQDNLPDIEAYYSRYIAHNENRLTYERTMLEAQGGMELLKPAPRPKQMPLLNYRAPEGIRIENRYHRGEFSIYPQVEMEKAEYSRINKDYKSGHKMSDHRVRVCMRGGGLVCVFLTDSKEHQQPEA